MERIIALIGNPVKNSLSPIIHNRAFSYLHLPYYYIPFEVRDLKLFCKSAVTLNFRGFNVTMPYKINIIKYLDEIDQDAKEIGAVNTVIIRNKRLKGYNTDGKGAVLALKEKINPSKKNTLIIGCGGAARAIINELKKEDVNIYIANRTLKKAKAISKRFGVKYVPLQKIIKNNYDIIINATPVGMAKLKDKLVVPKSIINKDTTIFDTIYNPADTPLIKEAKKNNCIIVTGIDMLVAQGALSFKLWTGKEAPVSLMKMAVCKEIS